MFEDAQVRHTSDHGSNIMSNPQPAAPAELLTPDKFDNKKEKKKKQEKEKDFAHVTFV